MQAEIAVVGAGPAGSTVARLLATHSRDVVLVDAGERETARLELLAPAVCSYAAAIGLGAVLDDPRISLACGGIRRAWGKARLVEDDFLAMPGGRGVVVDRARFDAYLRRSAVQAGARSCRWRIASASLDGDIIVLRQSGGNAATTIEARLVIDATGRAATIARRLGARRTFRERRIAVRLDVPAPGHESDGAGRCAGWLDIMGNAGHWTYAIEGAGGRREEWRVLRSAAAFAGKTVHVTDATSSLLDEAAGACWIAVGDAAATFDPITSQGLYNALSTATVAVGAMLSPGGLDADKASIYSQAVRETFWATERERSASYLAIKPDAVTS